MDADTRSHTVYGALRTLTEEQEETLRTVSGQELHRKSKSQLTSTLGVFRH
ncbi:rCG34634 [Rattus norvegicus]|uniref:RCG34634 n=1 Tax=Rattus norvegicus TaxID=10116 RepID=A6HDJ8_RAT|nr:rCG34634 [Rattus norvegicus]